MKQCRRRLSTYQKSHVSDFLSDLGEKSATTPFVSVFFEWVFVFDSHHPLFFFAPKLKVLGRF